MKENTPILNPKENQERNSMTVRFVISIILLPYTWNISKYFIFVFLKFASFNFREF